MDFSDNQAEAQYRAEAQAFLKAYFGDTRPKNEDENGAAFLARAKAYQKAKAAAGFAGITWPKEAGGQGLSAIQAVIFATEEAKFHAPVSPFAIGLGMCVPTVIAFANGEQKQRYVGPAMAGEEIWCQLFSEPSAGSDVAALRMSGVRDGDDWVINGQKVWTSGAHYSDFGIVLVRTNPEVAKHAGLSMFFVDMKSAGIDVRPIYQMSGGANFNEVYFDNVRIPHAQMLGAEGNGWQVALVTLMHERLAVGGSLGPDWAEIMGLANEIPAPNGGALYDDGVFLDHLADWFIAAEGYRLTKFRSMTALSRGQVPGPESAIGKIINATQMGDIAKNALDWMGAFGLIDDPKIAKMQSAFQRGYLWAPGLRIAGGTDEVLKNIIAERVLGLPQDVRTDKNVPFSQLPTS